MHDSARFPLAALTCLLAACTALPDDGALRVQLALDAPARRLAAVVDPYTAASINHVDVSLYALAGATETLKASQDVAGAQVAAATLVFKRLQRNATYRIKATAYLTAGTADAISDPALSQIDATVLLAEAVALAAVPVRLVDRTFAGQVAGGLVVTDGGLTGPTPTHAEFPLAVSTLAGTGVAGFADDPTGTSATTAAQFDQDPGVAVDTAGNVYVADINNHRIRKITPAGAVTTLAGTGVAGFLNDPFGTSATTAAQFKTPAGVAVDAAGNVYVADAGNHRVRKITPAGAVKTLAGMGASGFADDPTGTSAATGAQFNFPRGLGVDVAGNVYVADSTNHRIRKITPAGAVTTLAGTGAAGFADDPTGTSAASAAQFNLPYGVAVDKDGNVYVADSGNHRVRKVSPAGAVTTLAGTGAAGFADDPTGTSATTAAQLDGPTGVGVDPLGNVYVADSNNSRIRKITPAGAVKTWAGTGVQGFADDPSGTTESTAAQFNQPQGVAVDANGNVYVADNVNHRVRVIR